MFQPARRAGRERAASSDSSRSTSTRRSTSSRSRRDLDIPVLLPPALAPASYPAGVRTRQVFTGLLVTVLGLAGCGDAPDTSSIPPSSTGWVLFQQPDKTVELVAARPHGTMVNLSRRLGATGPAALSLNGRYVAVSTGDGCAAVSTGDFTHLEKVAANGTCVAQYAETMHISGNGDLLVFNGPGVHQRDLFVVRRTAPGSWSEPRNLTATGPFDVNRLPRLNPDATAVVYDCGNVPESDEHTNICQVGIEPDAPVRTVLAGDAVWTSFHSAAFLPDGGLVVECQHPHEELVCTVPPGTSTPQRLTATDLSNDNSPCAFLDGRVASL